MEVVELGEEAAAAAAAAAAVTVEVVEEASDVEEEADGECFSCSEEDVDRHRFGFWPAVASASVILLEIVIPLACFSCSKLFAELEEENFSSELAVKEPLSPDFFATLVSSEQLLKDAEFLTWVVLLMLSGTVQAALKDADR